MPKERITLDAIDRGYGDFMSGVYRDGCDLAPSCLSCPITSGCRYELPPNQARAEQQTQAIRALVAEGKTPLEIAAAVSLSRRSVYRLMRNARITVAGQRPSRWEQEGKRD